MKIVNLTPHELNFVLGDAEIKIPPSGQVARMTEKTEIIGDVDGIPIIRKTFGEVEDLPERQENTILVVSLLTAQAIKGRGRPDVFVIGESLRNEKGQVIGAKSLAVI